MEAESLTTATKILEELRRLRATAGRTEALGALKRLADEAYGPKGISVQDPGTKDWARWNAGQAIATLGMAYDRPNDLVPDALWDGATTQTMGWIRSETY